MRLTKVTALAAFAAAACVGGCGGDGIREYAVPKEPAPSMPTAAATAASTEPPASAERVEWTLPAGWREQPGGGMRFATLVADGGDPPLEVRVTPLAPIARQLLANVNRWRGQIGLDPVSEGGLPGVVRSERIRGSVVDRVDMTGPGSGGHPAVRVLAAILAGEDRVWFFLMTGPGDRVDRQAANFDRLVRSLRLGRAPVVADNSDDPLPDLPADHPPVEMPGDHRPVGSTGNGMAGMPAGHPPVGGAPGGESIPAGATELHWTLPAGWREVPNTSSVRVATLQFADGAQGGEVAITKFPGGAGGSLENVNRWRGQIGLPPVTSLEQQPTERVRLAGVEAARIDLVASGGADARRMIVVTVPRGDITYFIKLTGPNALLDRRRTEFDAFLGSIHFPEARS